VGKYDSCVGAREGILCCYNVGGEGQRPRNKRKQAQETTGKGKTVEDENKGNKD